MSSFYQLFLANFKMFYREKEGFYWTILMPAFIYIALSILPIGKAIDANLKYSNYVLPGIIAMTIMQGGIYSLAYWMVDLKARGIIKRLLATPLKQWQLALSLVSARLVVVIFQVIVLTLLGIVAFGASFAPYSSGDYTGFAGNIFSTLILVLLGGAIFLLFCQKLRCCRSHYLGHWFAFNLFGKYFLHHPVASPRPANFCPAVAHYLLSRRPTPGIFVPI